MEKLNIPKVNLCDITREPTDDELAALMNCVKEKVIRVQEEAASKLQANLQEEFRKARESHVKPR